jgi:hypothetical protein
MKPIIIIVAILIVLGGVGAYYLYGVARGAKTIIIMSRLTQASADLKKHGTFTNDIPQYCDIYTFTEHYTVGGSDYQCALAAKSPLFRGRGFMAITTNDVLLWIDKERGATPMSGPDAARQL